MIKKSIGPLFFTVIVLFFIQFVFELNFTFINSLKSTGEEVEMNDIFYSHIQDKTKIVNRNIVLVDIDTFKKPEILLLLKKINQYDPKVVGVDVLFEHDEPGETHVNYVLYASQANNTIFATKYNEEEKNLTHSFFIPETTPQAKEGLVNFGNSGPEQPVRLILNKHESDVNLMSFSAKIVELYDSSLPALQKIKNLESFQVNYKPILFLDSFHANEILNDTNNTYAEAFKGKIIIVGALNEQKDKHKIPNVGYAENQRLFTMESGMKIHALAIAMLMEDNTITTTNSFWAIMISSMVFLFFFYILFYLFEKYEFYFKLNGRMVLLLGGISLFLLYVKMMKFGIETPVGYWFFMIVLIYEMLEVYHPVMRLLGKLWSKINPKKV